MYTWSKIRKVFQPYSTKIVLKRVYLTTRKHSAKNDRLTQKIHKHRKMSTERQQLQTDEAAHKYTPPKTAWELSRHVITILQF